MTENATTARESGLDPDDPVLPWAQSVGALNKDIMLVGHLPFMSRLVSRLVDGDENADVVDFAPATVACLETTDDGGWSVAWVIRPERS